jgi:LPXTG-motif cell wall-anchored protein
MNIKSKRILAVSTIIALAGLLVNPSFAEDPVPTVLAAVETTAVVEVMAAPTTGTIYVENIVTNDNLGTKTAADFEFSITHFGADIAGSPFRVTETSGTHFVLAPGTYVVAIESMDGYLGTWSGDGVTNGFVDLKAGQEITFIRNTYDNGVAEVVFPTVDPATPCDPAGPNYQDGTCNFVTEDGGLLPVTGTNWFNALALGLLLSVAGAIVFRKSYLSN